jgi:drug/metabolite transporter (DMT)-like permease
MVSKKIFGYTCLALAASFWGAMLVVGKYTMDILPPLFVIWLRNLIAFCIMFVISFYIKKERIKRKDILLMAWIGFLGYFMSNGALLLGTHLSTAQLGSLIVSTPPIFTVFLATWFLKEKLNLSKIISVAIAIIGIVLVVGIDTGNKPDTYMLGAILVFISSISFALYTIFVKGAQHSAVFISAYSTGFGLLFFTPVMLLEYKEIKFQYLLDLEIILSILYLGVFATAVAFFLWNKGMQYVEAGGGSIFNIFNVIVGGILAWLVLGEKLTWNFISGSLLVLVAIIIMVKYNRDEEQKEIVEKIDMDEELIN